MKTILFIDGRNFISKINFILNHDKGKDVDFSIYDFKKLIDKVLTGLGFENSPNKGLTFTTNRTILIRNSEVLECREQIIDKLL